MQTKAILDEINLNIIAVFLRPEMQKTELLS